MYGESGFSGEHQYSLEVLHLYGSTIIYIAFLFSLNVSTSKLIILFCFLMWNTICLFGQNRSTLTQVFDTLPRKVDTLKAAVVTAKVRPHMKGDTMEYNTENYRLSPNANVEQLLAQLPGLRIGPDGTITYNGENIQHLLIDGEDMFCSDPTLVTRNFDGNKISRVEVLDRKSEQTLFTGVDDGVRTKTLNLILKKSARNGYFGKAEAGGNPDGYYNANAVLAAFKNKAQFTAIGLGSDIGMVGVSSDGGHGASLSLLGANADPLGASAGFGIPRYEATAIHYSNTWGVLNDHVNTNYQYGHLYSRPLTTSKTIETLSGSIYGQYQSGQSINQRDVHWLQGVYNWVPWRRSELMFTFHGSTTNEENKYFAIGNGALNDIVVNASQRAIQDKASEKDISGDISWKWEVGKRPENTLSIIGGFSKSSSLINGRLYSTSSFFQPNGAVQNVDTVDERKQIEDKLLGINGQINYTQLLWKQAILALSYGIRIDNDLPRQSTFSRGNGKYDELIDSLSSYLRAQTTYQRVTLNFQGKINHLSYSFGNNWLNYSHRQQDLLGVSVAPLHYLNWMPRVSFDFIPNSGIRFKFNYNLSTQEPSIRQLQPTKINNDPLHITLGNPGLRPGSSQNFRLEFNWMQSWMINFTSEIDLTNNSISTKIITDSLGRQITQPVNVNGGNTMWFNLSIATKICGMNVNFSAFNATNRTFNFVNSNLSSNNASNTGAGFGLSKYVADHYSFQFYAKFSYFNSRSSIDPAQFTHYWSQNHSGSIKVFFLHNLELNTNATYMWQENVSEFARKGAIIIWNNSLTYNFLKTKAVVRLELHNLLNNNAGVARSNTGNSNTETTTNILGRYWMVSTTWHFDRKFRSR